jgi:hypothetical protein
MNLLSALKIGTLAAGLFAATALAWMLAKLSAHGWKTTFAVASGSESRGIIYAFFKGMLPSEKESVRTHLPTFFAGILYHAGIFAALLTLVLQLLQVTAWPMLIRVDQVLIGMGVASGVALLSKRLALRPMRVISTPDDFVANILVDVFLVAALLVTVSPFFLPVFLFVSTLLFLYVPAGKIRHCVFFFCTRTIFGRLLGRRGVLPHPAHDISHPWRP